MSTLLKRMAADKHMIACVQKPPSLQKNKKKKKKYK